MQEWHDRRSLQRRAALTIGVCIAGLSGLQCKLTDGFIPTTQDQAAACTRVSPGGEVALGTALRGRIVKLSWSLGECTLTTSGANQTLTLVARNSLDGFLAGDTGALVTLTFTRNGGPIEMITYLDAAASSDQPHSFKVSASSTPSINCVPLFNGTGTATISSYKITGNTVTLKATFTLKVFEFFTAQVLDFCGDANFNGAVTVSP